MRNELNELMEFDHVVHVHEDGTVTDNDTRGLYAPELNMETDNDGQSIHADDSDIKQQAASAGWELLQGFTGQYSYSGPVMHPSEYIGGGLERHIRATPGYYVACVVLASCEYDGTTDCDIETGCDCEPAGWAIAYRESTGSNEG